MTSEIRPILNKYIAADGPVYGSIVYHIIVCGKCIPRLFETPFEAMEFLYDYLMGPAQ